MAIAPSPPCASTTRIAARSIRLMQSQSTLLPGLSRAAAGTSSARWPIANFGSVPMPSRPSPSSLSARRWRAHSPSSVVHSCPAQPTYWRSSAQIGQRSGEPSLSANCVPQVTQMACMAVELRSKGYSGQQLTNHVRRRLPSHFGIPSASPPRLTTSVAAKVQIGDVVETLHRSTAPPLARRAGGIAATGQHPASPLIRSTLQRPTNGCRRMLPGTRSAPRSCRRPRARLDRRSDLASLTPAAEMAQRRRRARSRAASGGGRRGAC